VIVTKGLGSNRIVSDGLGYQFSYAVLVQSIGGGGSGGPSYLRSYSHRIPYAARRPRRAPSLVVVPPIDPLVPAEEPAEKPTEPPTYSAVRGPSTGDKVVVVVGLTAAVAAVLFLL
jgi:hypothetical protein